MRAMLIGRIVLLATALAAVASAQSTFQFQLLETQSGSAFTIQNGALVALSSAVGQPQTVQIKATYTGLGQILIPQQASLVGSTAFTVSLGATPPVTLPPGGSISFTIQYLPTTSAQGTAQMSLLFVETLAATVAGSSPTTTTSAINLSLQGTSPSFILSYILQTNQNTVALQSGGTITFPATPVGTTAQAALDFTNTGSAAGSITGITITGSAFSLTGEPLFPQSVPAAQTFSDTGALQADRGFDRYRADPGHLRIGRTGYDQFARERERGESGLSDFAEWRGHDGDSWRGAITLPNTNVGQTSSIVMRVLNTGNSGRYGVLG